MEHKNNVREHFHCVKNMFDLYYFASCKIKFENNLSNEDKKLQKYFFLDYPYFLINSLKNFNFNFFYPSTSNIYENPNSEYSKIKKIAERKLKKICSKYQINFKTFITFLYFFYTFFVFSFDVRRYSLRLVVGHQNI